MKNFEAMSFSGSDEDKFDIQEMGESEKQTGYDSQYVLYDYNQVKLDRFNDKNLPWYERYIDLLPYNSAKGFKTLGECSTPLIPSKVFPNCYIKDEGRNPSGCYKDREAAVLAHYLSEEDIDKIALVSSGNAALSISLYGRMYGLRVKCVIPSDTSMGKRQLIQLFGGKLEDVDGIYEDCHYQLLDTIEDDEVNVSVGVSPLRDQGDKTIAYELVEELGPDIGYVIVPTANGALISGVYQGFVDLKKLGLITKIPKLIAVQIKDADPIKKAHEQGKAFVQIPDIPDSIAESIVAAECFASHKAVDALRATDGYVVAVEESELKDGLSHSIKMEGVIPEWSSAAAFSALLKLIRENKISKNDKVVVLNTGTGLKSLELFSEVSF